MSKVQTRGSISLRRDTIDALRVYRDAGTQSASAIVEGLLRPLLGLPPVEGVARRPEPVRPPPRAPDPIAMSQREWIDGQARIAAARRKARERDAAALPVGPMRAELPPRGKAAAMPRGEPVRSAVVEGPRGSGTVML